MWQGYTTAQGPEFGHTMRHGSKPAGFSNQQVSARFVVTQSAPKGCTRSLGAALCEHTGEPGWIETHLIGRLSREQGRPRVVEHAVERKRPAHGRHAHGGEAGLGCGCGDGCGFGCGCGCGIGVAASLRSGLH